MEQIEIEQKTYQLLDSIIKNGDLKTYDSLWKLLVETKNKLLLQGREQMEQTLLKEWLTDLKRTLETLPITGIQAGIQMDQGTELLAYGGTVSSSNYAEAITPQTRFDVASMTKLFTATQALKDHELRFIHLNDPLQKYAPMFQQAGTFLEELNFYHRYQTDGHIKYCQTEEEALQKLAHAKRIRTRTHEYDDLPYMMVRQALPDFEEHFKVYFQQTLQLKQTGYELQEGDSVTGGFKDQLRQVHDPKARIVSSAGHAGIYTTSHDLNQFYLGLSDEHFLERKSLELLSTPLLEGDYVRMEDGSIRLEPKFQNGVWTYQPIFIKRGMMYRHHGMGLSKTELLEGTGTHAFATSGFTGSWALFDLENGFELNLLTNPCSSNETGVKPDHYCRMLNEMKQKSLEKAFQFLLLETIFEEEKPKQYCYKI